MTVTAYIGIGSNIGDRIAFCRRAIELLTRAGRVVAQSSFYCTEPVGYEKQEDFVNGVVGMETTASPQNLFAVCRSIENELGRIRTVPGGPRTIDLDILLYGEQVVNSPDLVIPHAQLALRRFVLVPLTEIAPLVVHPVFNKTIAQLLHELKDPHRVSKCGAA